MNTGTGMDQNEFGSATLVTRTPYHHITVCLSFCDASTYLVFISVKKINLHGLFLPYGVRYFASQQEKEVFYKHKDNYLYFLMEAKQHGRSSKVPNR